MAADPGSPAAGAAPARPGHAARPSLRRRGRTTLAIAAAVLVVFAVLAGVGLGVAHSNRSELLGRLDPALQRSSDLLADLINEEAAIRGLVLAGNPTGTGPMLLEPYQQGLPAEAADRRELGQLLASYPSLHPSLTKLDQDVATWRSDIVEPIIQRLGEAGAAPANGVLSASTAQFNTIRADLTSLNREITHLRSAAAGQFDDAFWLILAVTIGVFVGVALLIVALWLTLRRLLIRPLIAVGTDSRRVAAGDFDHPVADTGPAEIADLANDIEAMRSRIVQDLRAIAASQQELESRSHELARSNRDLEQFAYVASHDLQEPLRKVASFCQLLSQRYRDQLDDRGMQYIDFAVDGARRMQTLVNDLLGFSRVGRTTEGFVPVDSAASLRAAETNLDAQILEADASIVVRGDLPVVRGDPTLIVALLQNLISNSLKFRGDDAPVVTLSAVHRSPRWEFALADNGIGIEPRFAERVFVIFQRLHTREHYEGTGIGLALCRKIVEFHGGDIWIDTHVARGTTIRFTLPEPTGSDAGPGPAGTQVNGTPSDVAGSAARV